MEQEVLSLKTTGMHQLSPNMATFCEHYVTGDDGVRGNATECYLHAGYTSKTRQSAAVKASQLMARPEVQSYIYELQMQASKAALDRLKSWRELAYDAQQTVVAIANGYFTGTYDVLGKRHSEPIVIKDRETAAAASVRLSAAKEILERAFPKKLSISVDTDDREILEKSIGRRAPEARYERYQ
jgi:hypothetical protein